jgi:small subunit ribosomal protein S18
MRPGSKSQDKKQGQKRDRAPREVQRFPDRGQKEWTGRLVDYKEIELLRKFLTSSNKLMSRKRAGTNAQEQRALKLAVKHARFLALLPYTAS